MDDTSTAAPAGNESSAPVTEGQQAEQNTVPTEQKPTPNVKKLKLKVDGQEFDEEIDLNDEEGLRNRLQLAKAAQRRMSEAAKARKEAEQMASLFKGNIKDVLKNADKLGRNPADIRKELEEYFAEQLEEEMLSPEQKAVRDAQRIIREREEEKKAKQQEEEARQMQELQQRYAMDYDKKFTEALSSSGLPKTPRTVKRMAELMSKNLDMGLDLEPKQLVELVREDYLNEIKELFSSSDGDVLLKLLGDDVATKIRKSDLARLKTQGLPQRKQEAQPVRPQEKPQKRMSTEEWLAERRRKAGL